MTSEGGRHDRDTAGLRDRGAGTATPGPGGLPGAVPAAPGARGLRSRVGLAGGGGLMATTGGSLGNGL